MKKLIFFLLTSILIIAQEKSNVSEDILFVGNSFTFYWNLPSIVEMMATERSLNWNVVQSTASGATLKQHWFEKKMLSTKQLILSNNFSKVIFQDNSTFPVLAIDTTKKYHDKFKGIISPNVDTYIYSTWMYPKIEVKERDLSEQNLVEKNLIESGVSESSILILVGQAFDKFKLKYPKYNLLSEDNKHQNANGTYLAACVIFSTLSNQSSIGLSNRYYGEDSNGKKIYYTLIDSSVAKKCQEISDSIVFNR
tara:strand:- start:140 stop:895 length:756 start_codon:yes stop_codon:yes gene_type:complete